MSKIEVNTVEPQCGTTLTVGKADTNLRTGGNSLQAADGGNLISQSGTAITLGASGDSINLASGASQTGFGRTGTVDWQTTPKTATFTAADGEGYFINSGSAITANLPAGSAGAIVAFSDYARNFATYNLTVSPDGSEKIGGIAADLTLSVNGQSLTLVYVDATKGWINIQNAEDTETGAPPFIVATGGTPSQDGDYEIRTFTGPGTFEVTNLSPTPAFNSIDYLVIAGGGGGGNGQAGGGGAGGFRESHNPAVSGCYTASPLATPTSIPVSVTSYPIVIGAGGPGGGSGAAGANGSPSTAFPITSTGGGGGGYNTPVQSPTCGAGGSGGGAGEGGSPGAGNTPPVSPPQGTAGGAYGSGAGSGGGGALVAGAPGTGNGGTGGAGTATSISGSPVFRSGGGGGGRYPSVPGSVGGVGGNGGGGTSGGCGTPGPAPGTAGTDNTGGGGGAPRAVPAPGNGGSGIVMIRYKFQ